MNFVKVCRESFKVLACKYQLNISVTDSENIYRLQNKTTGLEIIYERRDHAIFVQIYRLVDKEFPKYKSLHGYDSDSTNRFDVNFLIELRSSKTVASSLFGNPMKSVLDNYAVAVDEYAADVLNGDFSVFPKLTTLAKKNIQKLKRDGLL